MTQETIKLRKLGEENKPEEVGDSYLIDFYGTECPHCKNMEPLVQKLEEELGVKVARVEVWHSVGNAKYLQDVDQGKCGGVPFFFNMKNGSWFCGETNYEKLKEWAQSGELIPEKEHGTERSSAEGPEATIGEEQGKETAGEEETAEA